VVRGAGGARRNDALANHVAPAAAHPCAALQLAGEQVLYPVAELIGAWLAIGRQRRWQANPLFSPHALYCSSFIRHCYREASYDPFAADVALSNTAPEDIARAGVESGTMVRLR